MSNPEVGELAVMEERRVLLDAAMHSMSRDELEVLLGRLWVFEEVGNVATTDELREAIKEQHFEIAREILSGRGSFLELLACAAEERLKRSIQTLLTHINHIPVNGGNCATIPNSLITRLKEHSLNVLDKFNREH